MDGPIAKGWFRHPQLGLINIYKDPKGGWVYRCYSDNGSRVLSKERALDQWTWTLCQPEEE
jgi:hypothetical protein